MLLYQFHGENRKVFINCRFHFHDVSSKRLVCEMRMRCFFKIFFLFPGLGIENNFPNQNKTPRGLIESKSSRFVLRNSIHSSDEQTMPYWNWTTRIVRIARKYSPSRLYTPIPIIFFEQGIYANKTKFCKNNLFYLHCFFFY